MMSKLQDNYLEHKKIVNTKDLHDYLMANNRIRNGQVDLPISLQRYFVKTNNPYEDVKPRVYEEKKIYNPYKMNEWENKFRTDKQKKNKKGRFADRIFNEGVEENIKRQQSADL